MRTCQSCWWLFSIIRPARYWIRWMGTRYDAVVPACFDHAAEALHEHPEHAEVTVGR